ncbi:tandem-95 repeat protein [Pseudodonghicola xiamenensis]|uniref:tandem-95 repeat protein n=1 Tax=Pseudodonghicola xiamenensis TaxID=337702 RepID=UPI000401A52B|nr:tandem-95 repeat protein [Pseudodonghicola xiamenensis]
MTDTPTLYAHRGTDPYTDNQHDSYMWAFKYGADYVETDFRLTKDGELVTHHDDLPKGIANMTLEEIRQEVPGIITLEALIDLTKQMEAETGRQLGILVETKSSGYATYDALLSKLVAADFADPQHIVFQTFATDHTVLRDLMDNVYHVDFPLVWLGSLNPTTIADASDPEGSMGQLDGIAPQMTSLTKELVDLAHDAGLDVNGWTVVGTEADIRNALELGVDGIINDQTQHSRPALEKLLNNATVTYGDDDDNEINAVGGKDVVYAMSGNDIVRGGGYDDVLYGDEGDDLLFGGAGDDALVGGSGTDFLDGGAGSDTLDGGMDNDVIVATGDKVIFGKDAGIDLVSLDSTSTILLTDAELADINVISADGNLIIRVGDDALVLLDGVDEMHQPATITLADGSHLTGAELALLATAGTDADVAAALPDLQALLASAPDLAIATHYEIGTDLIAESGFEEGTLTYPIEGVEDGGTYRLTFQIADLPTGADGVRVLWGGDIVYEGVPSGDGDSLAFLVTGGAGDGANELVFEGHGETFDASLEALKFVKVADPAVDTEGNVAPVSSEAEQSVSLSIPFAGQIEATDSDGDTLAFILADGPSHGTLAFNSDGSYEYTADAGYLGADRFTYLVNDGRGGIIESAVNLNVVSNIAVGTDLIVNGSFEDLSESGNYNGGSDWGYRNQDGQIVGWTNVNNNRIEQHLDNYGGVVAKDGDIWIDMDHSVTGSLVDRIGQDIAGVEAGAIYEVSFSLSDSDIAHDDDGVIVMWNGEVIFDGLAPQNTTGINPEWETHTIKVVGGSGDGSNRLEFIDKGEADSWGAGAALDDVHFIKIGNASDENSAPVIDGDVDLGVVAEDSSVTLTSEQLLAHASDIDGDDLSITDLSASSGSLKDNGDGSWTFTPEADDDTEVTFSFTVSDGAESVTGSATLDITAVNDAPVIEAVAPQTTNEDVAIEGQIVASDVDGDTLSYAIAEGKGPTNGHVVIGASGNWTYTPDAGFNGEDSFAIAVSDGTATVEQIIDVAIKGLNDTPELSQALRSNLVSEAALGVPVSTAFDVEFGDDGFGSSTFTGELTLAVGAGIVDINVADGPQEVETLTSGGTPVTFALEDGAVVAYVAAEDGRQDILRVEIDGQDGAMTTLLGPIDHVDASSGKPIDQIDVDATIAFADEDGDQVNGVVRSSILNGAENMRMTGTSGRDHLVADAGDDVLSGRAGNDLLEGLGGDDMLRGAGGDDVLLGGNGKDVLIGGRGADLLKGGKGADILFGGKGDDLLTGGAGRDTLIGGRGDDILTGGGGADVFVFAGKSGHDMITDFEIGVDTLELSGFDSIEAVMDAATETDGGLLIDLGAKGSITLSHVNHDDLLWTDIVLA